MEITVYTLPNCLGCRHIKSLLNRANDVTWTEKQIGTDISKEDFDTQHPGVQQTPYTIIDGVAYENIIQVARKLLADGKVTAPTE
jgi:glutaredoxin